jgi:hypothetical protein
MDWIFAEKDIGMSEPLTGGCHCGAVRYTLKSEPLWGGHCQCTNCQKFSGTGHASNFMGAKADFEVSGDMIAYEYDADSGNHMTRYACAKCTTPIYGTSTGNPAVVVIRASSLDDPGRFQPKAVIYTNSAVAWDTADPDLPTFPGMPQR